MGEVAASIHPAIELAQTEEFIAALKRKNTAGLKLGALLAATLVPLFWVLDWLVMPEHLGATLSMRLFCSAYAVLMMVLLRARRNLIEQNVDFFATSCFLLPGWAIAVMCWLDSGYESPYYAGLILVFIAVGFLFTWTLRVSILFDAVLYGFYMAPLLIGAIPAQDITVVIGNQFFLLSTIVITLASQRYRYQLEAREFATSEALQKASSSLEASLKELQKIDHMKNEFFANISHELRTPLTLILAPVEELLTRTPVVPYAETLNVVRQNAERLLRLIDDLLDLARLDSGGLRLNVAPVELVKLAHRLVDAFQPAAHTRKVTLKLHTMDATPNLFGDPHRLEIVVTNLIGNALKFTPAGGEINVRLTAIENGVKLEVQDTGPGISEADLKRIFDRFYQVEGSSRRRFGGAGIGLALANELVKLHDGELNVVSVLGQGATFSFTLPLGMEHFRSEVIERRAVRVEGHAGRRAEDRLLDLVPMTSAASVEEAKEAIEQEAILLERGRKPRILVTEDNDELRAFIISILQPSFEVLTATNGKEGLDVATKERPDLVLSDVMMPIMSGTELCRALKSHESLRNTPVILLTARTGSDAALEGYGSGADDFVNKPFHARVLIARVRAHLKLRSLSLQLAAQSRLATAATLAAGVAHEIKNPINAILNSAAVLQTPTVKETVRVKLLGVIDDGARRILDIVTALDEQVRPADGEVTTLCDVRVGLDSGVRLLEHRVGEIMFHKDYRSEKPVIAEPRQLNQVFLNLIDNAIRMKPSNIWLTVEELNGMLAVTVSDDGPGITPEVAAHIFDPFFTTRPIGEGTGLGLYISRQIVRNYGGDLRVGNRTGGGAEFSITLPTEPLRKPSKPPSTHPPA